MKAKDLVKEEKRDQSPVYESDGVKDRENNVIIKEGKKYIRRKARQEYK